MSLPLKPRKPGKVNRPLQRHRENTLQYGELAVPNEFRLLRLRAGHGDQLHCELHHYILRSAVCPSYRAISYTWGKGKASFPIQFPGGSVFHVRDNLKKVLRSIRDEESDSWLWIDAICINQGSNEERNHQVKLMAQIYGNANVVNVWLQSSGESTKVAKAFEFVHAAVSYHSSSEDSVYQYCNAHTNDSVSNWRAVLNFFNMRYWTRKWIIQELVNARTVVLRTGDRICSMEDLETFCRQLRRIRDHEGYRQVGGARLEFWDPLVASPAARLALQRAEARERR